MLGVIVPCLQVRLESQKFMQKFALCVWETDAVFDFTKGVHDPLLETLYQDPSCQISQSNLMKLVTLQLGKLKR